MQHAHGQLVGGSLELVAAFGFLPQDFGRWQGPTNYSIATLWMQIQWWDTIGGRDTSDPASANALAPEQHGETFTAQYFFGKCSSEPPVAPEIEPQHCNG